MEEAGGCFVSRCKGDLNPTIVVAYVDGKRQRGLEGKKLKDVRAKLKGKNADLIVQWPRYGDGFEPRLLFPSTSATMIVEFRLLLQPETKAPPASSTSLQ